MRPNLTACGRPAETLVQLAPPSLLTHTRPSSVPTQITLPSLGASEMERMVSVFSALEMSWNTGPPAIGWCALRLRVRSFEIGCQFAPPSVDLNRTLPPMYTVLGSVAETAIGELQLKRYFNCEIGVSPMLVMTGRMNLRVQFFMSMREVKPVCDAA